MKVSISTLTKKYEFDIPNPSQADLDAICKIVQEEGKRISPKAKSAKKAKPAYWNVYLTDIGPMKITVIKAVREITKLELKPAKDLVETPNALLAGRVGEKGVKVWRDAMENAKAKIRVRKVK